MVLSLLFLILAMTSLTRLAIETVTVGDRPVCCGRRHWFLRLCADLNLLGPVLCVLTIGAKISPVIDWGMFFELYAVVALVVGLGATPAFLGFEGPTEEQRARANLMLFLLSGLLMAYIRHFEMQVYQGTESLYVDGFNAATFEAIALAIYGAGAAALVLSAKRLWLSWSATAVFFICAASIYR